MAGRKEICYTRIYSRGISKSYCAQKNLAVKAEALKQGKRGKRTMLPAQIYEKVLEIIRNMGNAGAVTNFHTVVALATCIVLANDRTLLKENGGYCWIHYWMVSMYLQTIKLCQKKISDSETPHSSWFDKRNWIFFITRSTSLLNGLTYQKNWW